MIQEAEFIGKEYDMLHSYRSDLLQIMESRLNVFLVTIGGYVALIAALLQSYEQMKAEFTYTIPILGAVTSITIILIGIITFERMIKRSIEIVLASRAINKVREQFLKDNVSLTPFITLAEFTSDTPSFEAVGYLVKGESRFYSLPNIIAVLNSMIITIALVAACRLVYGEPTGYLFVLILAFAYSLYVHDQIYKNELENIKLERAINKNPPVEGQVPAQQKDQSAKVQNET